MIDLGEVLDIGRRPETGAANQPPLRQAPLLSYIPVLSVGNDAGHINLKRCLIHRFAFFFRQVSLANVARMKPTYWTSMDLDSSSRFAMCSRQETQDGPMRSVLSNNNSSLNETLDQCVRNSGYKAAMRPTVHEEFRQVAYSNRALAQQSNRNLFVPEA